MKSILLLFAFAIAISLFACKSKEQQSYDYSDPRFDRAVVAASPTPRPSATPGLFDKPVDPAGIPTTPRSH